MSVKGSSTGHGSAEKVLRRKLTGPLHPLPGKSKMNNGTGGRSVQTCRHNGSNNSCGMTEVSGRSCEEQISEEVAAKSATELQRRADDRGKKREASIGKPVTAAKSPFIDQDKMGADKSDRNQFTQRLTALRQVFSPSVACFRCVCESDERGDCDEGEYHAVTFFNRQTRDSVDLTAQSAVKYGNAELQRHLFAKHKSAVAERETSKTKTFKLFKRLIAVPKCQSKSEFSLQHGSLIPCSFTKEPKPFWRHRTKKPSPFFQEHIGESKDYIEEETIVLANKHADDDVKSVTLSPHLENDVRCHCYEMLTVSVDVTSEIKEDPETSEGARASETPSPVSTDVKVVVELQGNLGEGFIGGKESQMRPYSSKEHCNVESSMMRVSQGFGVCQNVVISHRQQDIHNLTSISNSTASEHSAGGKGISLHPTYNSDLNAAHSNAPAGSAMNPTVHKIPEGTVTDNNGAVAEDLHSHTSDDVQSCGTEQSICPDTLYVRMAHSEGNAERGCDEREIFLMETARSVVQDAIKAALDQFEGKLMDSVASVDQQD